MFRFGKPCLIAALAALAVLVSSLAAPAAPDYLARADELFAQRADLAKARQAAALYEKALQADPKSQAAAYKLARTYYWIGKHQETDEQKVAVFAQGIAAAKKALAIDPQSIGGHYWLGVCYGVYGSAKGVMKSLSLVDPIKQEMAAVIARDPSYDSGGAYRVLGRLYFKLPGLFGGSNRKAVENLKTAIKYGPRRWLNHIYLAEVYIDEGEKEKARDLLQKVLAGPAEPGMEPEWAEEKVTARKLLQGLE